MGRTSQSDKPGASERCSRHREPAAGHSGTGRWGNPQAQKVKQSRNPSFRNAQTRAHPARSQSGKKGGRAKPLLCTAGDAAVTPAANAWQSGTATSRREQSKPTMRALVRSQREACNVRRRAPMGIRPARAVACHCLNGARESRNRHPRRPIGSPRCEPERALAPWSARRGARRREA